MFSKLKTPIAKGTVNFSSLSEALTNLLKEPFPMETLEPLIEMGPGAAYLVDAADQSIRYLSPKAKGFLPPSFFTLISGKQEWSQLVHPDDWDHFQNELAQFEKFKEERVIEYRIAISKKGGWLPIQDFRLPLRNGNGEIVGYVGHFIDDSFRIQAMETLVRRSWKEVATAITKRFLHDFNNTIAGIFSLSELYSLPGSDINSMTEAMGHIRDNSIKAQKLTQKIRELSTMVDGERSYFDLEKLIVEQKDYLEAILPKGAGLQFQFSGNSMPAHLDANRFKQALLHLATNSRDAADKDFEVSIHCSKTTVMDGAEKPAALIEFKDNGHGIPESDLPKALDPFFTTKDPRQNTGIGLYIVKNFATELGGGIEIFSEPDEGTTVALTLPLADLSETFTATPPPAPSATATPKPSQERKSPPKILIYTWEDITRHPYINALREEGWKYRIHLDADQLMLDIKDMREDLDGVLLFKSALDENAEPLIERLYSMDTPPKLAIVALGESIDAITESIKTKCEFIAAGSSKPGSLLKKLSKYYR